MRNSEYLNDLRGVVTERQGKKLIIELEDGQQAHAYFCNLPVGTHVMCTMIKEATDFYPVLLSIDSHDYDDRFIA